MKMFKNGFTTAEMLVCLALIAIIAAMLLPAVLARRPAKNKAMFRKAYNNVERITYELINNTDVFPQTKEDEYLQGEDLSTGFAHYDPEQNRDMDDTGKFFCKMFSDKLNTSGQVLCDKKHEIPSDGEEMSSDKPLENNSSSPSFVTNDGITWFYTPAKLCALDENGKSRPEDIECKDNKDSKEGVKTPSESDYNDYVCFDIDVNGNNKPNSRSGNNPDRFRICIYYDGKVVVPNADGVGKEVEFLRSTTIFDK